MNKLIVAFVLSCLIWSVGYSQKFYTKSGNISFYSKAPLEDIEAHNKKATSVLDMKSGKLEFAVLIKAFHFEKALMQEHFNENYMESDKFPKSSFKGSILAFDDLSFEENSVQNVKVSGDLTIHGITRTIETEANLQMKENAILATSDFFIEVADYGIEIPSVVKDNIAKTVRVFVNLEYIPLNKSSE